MVTDVKFIVFNKFSIYYMSENGSKEKHFYVFGDSHYYVYYEKEEKIVLHRTLQMESLVLPTSTVIIGIEHLQRAGVEFFGLPNLHNNFVFHFKYLTLPDDIEFSYGDSFATEK